ncbi:MAG: hypothetical protein U0704_05850 [Candidatus Eisenbacteria bacterium]
MRRSPFTSISSVHSAGSPATSTPRTDMVAAPSRSISSSSAWPPSLKRSRRASPTERRTAAGSGLVSESNTSVASDSSARCTGDACSRGVNTPSAMRCRASGTSPVRSRRMVSSRSPVVRSFSRQVPQGRPRCSSTWRAAGAARRCSR